MLGEKHSDACEDIHIAQATQKKAVRQKTLQARRVCCRRRSLVCQFQTKYNTRKGDKLSTKRLGPVFVAETCGKNTYKLIGLKRKFHSDQLVKVKRAITGDIVPSAKTEVGMCDGAQHSDENGSIQKVKRTRTADVTPDCDSAQESAKKEITRFQKGRGLRLAM